MGDKEYQFGHRTIDAAKAVLRLDMIFIRSVQPLYHLLVWPVLFRFIVQVLQADHVFQGQLELVIVGIDEVQVCLLGWVAIGDQRNLLLFISSPDGLKHRGDGGFCPAVIAEVVGGNFL